MLANCRQRGNNRLLVNFCMELLLLNKEVYLETSFVHHGDNMVSLEPRVMTCGTEKIAELVPFWLQCALVRVELWVQFSVI